MNAGPRYVARLFAMCLALGSLASLEGCATRTIPARGPTYDDVGPVLAEHCASCHGAERAEGGYRVGSYVEATACAASAPEALVVRPPDASAPIVAVLDRPDHSGLLSTEQRALLLAWVEAGAPAGGGGMHPSGWSDPRSEDFHGEALRADGWALMLDPNGPEACARCHAGADRMPDPENPRGTAAGATACTSCHTDEDGPFACSTCHGAQGRAYPPRDLCRHPDEVGRGGAHEAHLTAGLACSTCHAERTIEGLADPATSGHGDGLVAVALDPTVAGEGAAYDHTDGTCATRCHDRGGSVSSPRWLLDRDLTCGSCHQSPPADHYDGTCDRCHAEASADGTSLVPGPLHANGQVDLGDGSGTCGACHGEGDDPRPSTGAHPAHGMPTLASPFACAECHAMPTEVGSPGHIDDSTPGAEVIFGALARARGATPTRVGETCSQVACHGEGLGGQTFTAPRWDSTDGAASRCGACHGVPPPAPHPSDSGCSSLLCHGGYTTPGPGVSELGRTVHVDGDVDLWSGR